MTAPSIKLPVRVEKEGDEDDYIHVVVDADGRRLSSDTIVTALNTPAPTGAQVAALKNAMLIAIGRFSDLATIIERDGSYDNAGFMRGSADGLRSALSAVLAPKSGLQVIADEQLKREPEAIGQAEDGLSVRRGLKPDPAPQSTEGQGEFHKLTIVSGTSYGDGDEGIKFKRDFEHTPPTTRAEYFVRVTPYDAALAQTNDEGRKG